MSEFRQNPINKNWVLIAPNRAKRPEAFKAKSVMAGAGEFDSACVFCPGNEDKNKELARYPKKGDWDIRVIENKFHAVEQTTVYRNRDFYNSISGYGEHEVIITRKHNEPVAMQSIATIEQTLLMYQERMKALSANERIAYVQVFHNHGRDAGASLIHPHHQLIATPIIPPHVHNEIRGCYDYYNLNKSCVYCDIRDEEVSLKKRIVHAGKHFTVLSAYASRSPFETWILPNTHGSRFEDIDKTAISHLASVLKATLGQLYSKLGDPPLNFYIHSLPQQKSSHILAEESAYHWHMTIFPRISIWAGFEFATGIPINPVLPEDTAEFLKH